VVADDRIEIEIVLDNGKIVKGFQKVAKKSKTSGKKAGDNFQKGFDSGLKTLRNRLIGAAAAFGAAFAGRKIIAAAIQQEDAVNNLNTALKLSGQYSEEASQSMQEYASSLQSVSTIGDEVLLDTAALIQSLGALEVEGLKRATTAAADLSAALGIDLKAAATLVGKAATGEISSFTRYGLIIKKGSSAAETFANALTQLEGKFGGAAAAKVNTFSGAFDQLSNSFGDVLEEIGFTITKSPVLINTIKSIAKSFGELSKSISDLDLARFFDESILKVKEWSSTIIGALASIGLGLALLKSQAIGLALVSGFETAAISALYLGDAIVILNAKILATVTSLGFLKVALVSTGIGAAIVAFGYLVKNFIDLKNAGHDTAFALKNAFGLAFKRIEILAIEMFIEVVGYIKKIPLIGESLTKGLSGAVDSGLEQIGRIRKEIRQLGITPDGETIGEKLGKDIVPGPGALELMKSKINELRGVIATELSEEGIGISEEGEGLN